MKFSLYFAEIVSEFSGFQHTPGFKASRSSGDLSYISSSNKSSRRSSTESKRSINISVGVHDISRVSPSPPHSHFVKRYHTVPSVSRMASLSSLQEKLQRLKRSESMEPLRDN